MKKILWTLLIISACNTDLTERPAYKLLPSCLIVSSTPVSWQRDHVQKAAEEINTQLKLDLQHAIRVAPICHDRDELVPISFMQELPDRCSSPTGCTFTTAIRTSSTTFGRPMREIVIQEDAPYRTILHELKHLAGCRHNDWPPC